MIIVLALLIFCLLCALGVQYARHVALLNRLDAMLDAAIGNTFSETDFTESRLSKIEAKMYRYLTAGQASLAQVNGEKDRIKALISDLSHQTKTPIANILLYTQLLCDRGDLNGQAASLAGQIESQTEKLSFLIQSLVKISRLENGILSVAPKEREVQRLLSGLDFTGRAQEKGITLSVEEENDLTAVFDLKWTLEAVSNIVENAIKYTPRGGRVTVRAMPYELFVKLTVEDNGIGICEEEFPKIFARFYRSPKVSECAGVGIGLYLARELIAKQGGYIQVASKEGEGSVFSIFLPRQTNLSKL